MTDDGIMTAEEIAAALEAHHARSADYRPAAFANRCALCARHWPCDSYRLATTAQQAMRELAKATKDKEQYRTAYNELHDARYDVIDERDRLTAELAERTAQVVSMREILAQCGDAMAGLAVEKDYQWRERAAQLRDSARNAIRDTTTAAKAHDAQIARQAMERCAALAGEHGGPCGAEVAAAIRALIAESEPKA